MRIPFPLGCLPFLRRLRRILRYAALLTACGRSAPEPAQPSPLETAIARELTARSGAPVTVSCLPTSCRAELADHTVLPIRVGADGSGWSWQVDGLVVDTALIVSYIDAMLADLHVHQTVSCGGKLRLVAPGERLGCALSGGGTAFVDVAQGGPIQVELALGSAAAAARSQPTPAEQLDKMSRALAGSSATDEP